MMGEAAILLDAVRSDLYVDVLTDVAALGAGGRPLPLVTDTVVAVSDVVVIVLTVFDVLVVRRNPWHIESCS